MHGKSPIRKHAPHPRFKDYIHGYWTLCCFDNERNAIYCMALDSGLDLIFNLSDPIECIVDDSSPVTIAGDFMVGSLARQIQIKPIGFISLFAIRFTSEGLYPFLSMPPVDLSDFCVDIEEVWELNGLGLSKKIHGSNQEPERLIQTFEGFFARRMNDFKAHSSNVEKAVAIIRSHKGQIPVEAVAKRLQISSRHLERKFTERIGISPKQLCRVFRIKNVLINLKAAECDWASFAVACGYFDQAHFIHEFKSFTGKSPMRYLTGEGLFDKTTANFKS
jgi:AraC-like DNA-binding protein